MSDTGRTYDAIVIGLGAMGSAVAFHLARRGVKVLGLERFAPGHTRGSSHGDSRLIRDLYWESQAYLPLIRRAYALWEELERESDSRLMHLIGGITMGPPDGRVMVGTRNSAIQHGYKFDCLTAAEVHARFPAFRPPEGFVGIWDPHGGYLLPEDCIRAHLSLAERYGATLQFDEQLLSWEPDGNGVVVTTASGRYHANRLVLSAGAWMTKLLPELTLPLMVTRQVLNWFDPPSDAKDDAYAREHFPVYVTEYTPGNTVYGLPRLPRGVKAGLMYNNDSVDPDEPCRPADANDTRQLRDVLSQFLPGLRTAPVVEAVTCLFTNTPDRHFIIDLHPEYSQVAIASPCSGHGFKFSSVVGEIEADLVMDGRSRFDITPFRIDRFAQ